MMRLKIKTDSLLLSFEIRLLCFTACYKMVPVVFLSLPVSFIEP